MKTTKHISILGLFFLCALQLTFSQTLDLEKGAKYQADSKVKSMTTIDMMGRSMETTSTINSTLTVEVSAIKNEHYFLTNQITALSLTSLLPMGREITIDSENPEDLQGKKGEALKKVLNKEINVEMDKNGNIISINTNKVDGEFLKVINGNYSKTGYGATMVFLPLPKDLAVGKSWTNTTNSAGVTANMTYTVKAIEGDKATLSVSGDMAIDKTVKKNGMSTNINLKGTFTGETVVNKATNVIQNASKTIKMEGVTKVMTQEIPMNITTKTTTQVNKI